MSMTLALYHATNMIVSTIQIVVSLVSGDGIADVLQCFPSICWIPLATKVALKVVPDFFLSK